MKKTTSPITLAYIYDPAHKGANYSLNGGESWTNNGEFSEVICKAALGYAPVKDACGRYDVTDDIPEIGASVKSSKATLVNMVLGFDFQSVKAHYMATVHSTCWIWVSHSAEEVTMYEMDKEEFSEFMDMWSSFDKDRKVIRFKAESQKMLRWLEDKVG